MNYLPQMYKALVPVVVGAALTALSYLGITGQMTIEEVLTFAVTAGLVWLVPNKK
jgi:hypothetical protein